MRPGEVVEGGPGYEQARAVLIEVLDYRAMEDLRRAWRVAQPNLEQTGLLRVGYAGLAALAADERLWKGAPGIDDVSSQRREAILRAVLDHLRSELAIDAECLADDHLKQLSRRSRQRLGETWALDEHEILRHSAVALLPGEMTARDERTIGLGARSAVGRYLRSRHTWGIAENLSTDAVEIVVRSIVRALRGHILRPVMKGGIDHGVQIKADVLLWERGDGRAPGPDPVRARSLHYRRVEWARREPNRYFTRLYRERALALALVPVRDEVQSIDRPRFLGFTEFGPGNVIYHEGRKNRIKWCVLTAGGFESRITRAKLCNTCGYVHPGDTALVDTREHCGTRFADDTPTFPQRLFDQPTVRATRWARITSDEEERSQLGYEVTTHYRFAPATPVCRTEVVGPGGDVLLDVAYAARSELWRINHGWRRGGKRQGFSIDVESGQWVSRSVDDEDPSADPAARRPVDGVRPYVTDHRNLLLARPNAAPPDREAFLISLGYALRRGIQAVFQVEEREVEVEPIGAGEHERLLFWEAAEGGTGVWERLVGEPTAIAQVARAALRVGHFDPDTGAPDIDWSERCTAACYECLQSYSNQRVQHLLNRFIIRDYLLALTNARSRTTTESRPYDEQYAWLRERTDPASDLETAFLDFVQGRKLRLPDHAQYRPDPEVLVQVDFYYERRASGAAVALPGICIFIDGPAHDRPDGREHDRVVREELRDRGFRVIAIRYDREFAVQVAEFPDVF